MSREQTYREALEKIFEIVEPSFYGQALTIKSIASEALAVGSKDEPEKGLWEELIKDFNEGATWATMQRRYFLTRKQTKE